MTVLLSPGSALLVHVSCNVRGQKLRFQLTQRNIYQTKFGACAVRQTAFIITAAIIITIIRLSVQRLRKTDERDG